MFSTYVDGDIAPVESESNETASITTKENFINSLYESISLDGSNLTEKINKTAKLYVSETIEGIPSFPSKIFADKNLERFRVEQLCKDSEGKAICEFLKNVGNVENKKKLFNMLFEYPAQQAGTGSCARSSLLINLWINNPLEYLKLANKCLTNPTKVEFKTINSTQYMYVSVDASTTSQSTVDKMECALVNLSLDLDADGKIEGLKQIIGKCLNGFSRKDKQPLSTSITAMMQTVGIKYDSNTGIFSFKINDQEAWDLAFEDLKDECGENITENRKKDLKTRLTDTVNKSSKGITFNYLDHLTIPNEKKEFNFSTNGTFSLLTANDLVIALNSEPFSKQPVVLAKILSTIGLGHAFNLRTGKINTKPEDMENTQILNLGLSNYTPESGGKCYVGLKKIADDKFSMVMYPPDRPDEAESMLGNAITPAKIELQCRTFVAQLE
ncbi:MAG: hypothetical protein LBI81_00485 [Puniceicoccales bacterium]|jgi:hypothetical protein|nr:hypothetical protein [Puniceicoccales bacterium]